MWLLTPLIICPWLLLYQSPHSYNELLHISCNLTAINLPISHPWYFPNLGQSGFSFVFSVTSSLLSMQTRPVRYYPHCIPLYFWVLSLFSPDSCPVYPYNIELLVFPKVYPVSHASVHLHRCSLSLNAFLICCLNSLVLPTIQMLNMKTWHIIATQTINQA